MDNLDHYREVVQQILAEYAHKPSHGEIESEIIVDPKQDHYEIMHVGWDKSRRVHGSVIHIDIINGKIWIQHDGTSPGIALELVEAGIPKEDIVLGFRPAHVRQYTGYSVGEAL
jgi:hypothetical protein